MIAQASLIERIFLELGPSDFDYSEWVGLGRGQTFFLQGLADLRIEPRWLPDFMSPSQLKLEFLGRIRNAGFKAKDTIQSDYLRAMILGDGEESLTHHLPVPLSFLPGPLEGGEPSPNPLPAEFLAQLKAIPEGAIPQVSAFAGLVNAAFIFSLDASHARLAADALRTAKYQLDFGSTPEVSFSLLAGLASVAAVTRATDLADEVRLLTKALNARTDASIETESWMRIGLIASAAHSDPDEWCKSVGNWFSDIAFSKLDSDSAKALCSHLRVLCHLVPRLWTTCSAADAALMSVPD